MRIGFVAGAKYRGKLYFSALNMNGFFSYDLSTHALQLIDVFEKEPILPWLHCEGALYQSKLWLLPLEARYMTRVDLVTKKISYYEFSCHKKFSAENLFHGIFPYGDNIYLIPHKTDTFFRVNMCTDVIQPLGYADFDLHKYVKGMCMRKDRIALVTADGEIEDLFDSETGGMKRWEGALAGSDKYMSALQTQDDVWLIPSNGDAIKRYSLREETVRHIQLPDANDIFYHGMDLGASVIFFPAGVCRRFVVVDKMSNELRMIDDAFIEDSNESLMGLRGWFEMHTVSADEGYWAASNDGFIFEFSEKGDILHTYHIEIEKSVLKEKLQRMYKRKDVLMGFSSLGATETDMIDMDELVAYLKYHAASENGQAQHGTCMQEVHRKWADLLKTFCR